MAVGWADGLIDDAASGIPDGTLLGSVACAVGFVVDCLDGVDVNMEGLLLGCAVGFLLGDELGD